MKLFDETTERAIMRAILRAFREGFLDAYEQKHRDEEEAVTAIMNSLRLEIISRM